MSTKKITQDEFIKRCLAIYGTNFDYSQVLYKNMTTKVKVICNKCCNYWLVTPANHVGPRRSGCPTCKSKNSSLRSKKVFNLEWFVAKSNKIHKNFYDYSHTIYLDTDTKVLIICPIHGEFSQWPSDHMRGIGCSMCSGNRKKTTQDFIYEAKKIFPNYDYTNVEYSSAHSLITVGCPSHGLFTTKPNALLNKTGCGKCSVDRQLTTKIAKGIIRDPKDIPEYELYRRKVWQISNQQFNEHYYLINPHNLSRGYYYHLDHKYSIQQGWYNNVPPEIIGGWKNLQILPAKQNKRKSYKCSVTLEDIQ